MFDYIDIARLESTGCDEVFIGIPYVIEGAAAEAKLEIEIELLIITITCMSWPRRCLFSKCWRIRLDCPTYELFQAVVWNNHIYCQNL